MICSGLFGSGDLDPVGGGSNRIAFLPQQWRARGRYRINQDKHSLHTVSTHDLRGRLGH